jgi:hypothetical protein
MAGDEDLDGAAVVGAVALKLPIFWSAQPEVWFSQAEAQFHIRKITEDATKYYYVVASLDQETASRVVDMLSAPPSVDKHQALKKRLTDTFGLSRRDRAAKLLHIRDLGDRKPSQLMDEMLALLDGHQACLLFEQVFLERMPQDIRLQLSEDNFANPRTLALRADVLWQAKSQGTLAIGKVSTGLPASRPATSGASRNRDGSDSKFCFYHTKFGSNAQKCNQPCSFPGNGLAGRQ